MRPNPEVPNAVMTRLSLRGISGLCMTSIREASNSGQPEENMFRYRCFQWLELTPTLRPCSLGPWEHVA